MCCTPLCLRTACLLVYQSQEYEKNSVYISASQWYVIWAVLATLVCIFAVLIARGKPSEVYEVLLVGPGLVIAGRFIKAFYAARLQQLTAVRYPKMAKAMPGVLKIAAYSATCRALLPIVLGILACIVWYQYTAVDRHWAVNAAAYVFGEVFCEWNSKLWDELLPTAKRQQLLHVNQMQGREVGILHVAHLDLLFGKAPDALEERRLSHSLLPASFVVFITALGGLLLALFSVVRSAYHA